MNARTVLLSLSALLATTLTSCGTLNRAGKDVFLGVGTPVLMIYGGATDGYDSSMNVRKGMQSGGAVQVLVFPFTFAYHAVVHGFYGLVHIADLPMCAFYGAAELIPPAGPEIKPLDIYQGTWFDKWASPKKSTDAVSGEQVSGN